MPRQIDLARRLRPEPGDLHEPAAGADALGISVDLGIALSVFVRDHDRRPAGLNDGHHAWPTEQ